MQAHPDPARGTRRRAVPESQALSEGINGEARKSRNGRPAVSMTKPGSGWPAVAAAVRQRMAALRITTAGLSRNTGLSEATLRNIRAGTASPRPGTLIRLSKGLGWPGGYLEDVAGGKAYLPHGLMTVDVIARIDARLARVENKLDKLLRPAGRGQTE
jgi:transcriptional regulator with XRE-family HTH domain